MSKHFDTGSLIIILITLVLFVLALFTKGFAHALLLEAGVFLASAKLIIMAYKSSVINSKILKYLEEIIQMLTSKQV